MRDRERERERAGDSREIRAVSVRCSVHKSKLKTEPELGKNLTELKLANGSRKPQRQRESERGRERTKALTDSEFFTLMKPIKMRRKVLIECECGSWLDFYLFITC